MAAGSGHFPGTNAVKVPKIRPNYWSNCQIALHALLNLRVTQTGAPNQIFSRCQRHGCEEFEAALISELRGLPDRYCTCADPPRDPR